MDIGFGHADMARCRTACAIMTFRMIFGNMSFRVWLWAVSDNTMLKSMPAAESNTRLRGDNPSQLEFTRLFVASQAAFHGFLLTLVHDRHAADDLVQELACRLWLRFGDYERSRPFVAWGLGFARLLAFEWRRHQARLPVPLDEPTLQALADVATERSMASDERHEALGHCLQLLTDHQRQVLQARYYRDQAVAEIARQTQRTEMAVYKVLKRAHQILLDVGAGAKLDRDGAKLDRDGAKLDFFC
ncbi:MAG: sigma-70 family RNA polymerase sigma factor [Verrucomicrobia bacterium]|nr:sigma-70 family RNA polymerase sigma factor [Verrucomicrobiota bacterium]